MIAKPGRVFPPLQSVKLTYHLSPKKSLLSLPYSPEFDYAVVNQYSAATPAKVNRPAQRAHNALCIFMSFITTSGLFLYLLAANNWQNLRLGIKYDKASRGNNNIAYTAASLPLITAGRGNEDETRKGVRREGRIVRTQ